MIYKVDICQPKSRSSPLKLEHDPDNMYAASEFLEDPAKPWTALKYCPDKLSD